MPWVAFAVLILIWASLSGGGAASWAVGLPALFLALWAKRRISRLPPFRIALARIPVFAAYFFWESTHGGVDVALRALRPSMPLAPKMHTHRFRLKNEVAQIFFAHAVSLLPGTLSADYREGSVELHLLDGKLSGEKELQRLERQIALLFGEEGHV